MRSAVFALAMLQFYGSSNAGTLEEVAASPPASGVIVTRIPEHPNLAKSIRLQPGDIIIACNGKAVQTAEGLAASMEEAAGPELKRYLLTYIRDGKEHTTIAWTFPLGAPIAPVEKGKAIQLRPPATEINFDYSSLAKQSRDNWYAYFVDGKHVGFERHLIAIKKDQLTIRSEIVRDTDNDRCHVVITTTVTPTNTPKFLETHIESRLGTPFSYTIKPEEKGVIRTERAEGGATETQRISVPPDAQFDQVAKQLAAFIPLKKGTCFHYTRLAASGHPEDACGLYVEEAKAVDFEGKTIRVIPVIEWANSQKIRTAWIDPESRTIMKLFYGKSAVAVRTTKDRAVKGIDPKIVPSLPD